MNILQVNTSDVGGGAERISATLHHAYNVHGHNVWMAVGRKYSQDNNIFYLPAHKAYCDILVQQWIRFTERLPGIQRARGAGLFRKLCEQREELLLRMMKALGHENFHFPATSDLLNRIPQTPDIVHCHNLHGGYFDLRVLPKLSKQLPVVMTLHDAWLLSGHCAHSFDCDRWKIGCGKCPDLSIPPALQQDATAYNWRKKHNIFQKSRLYIATPSHWLMQKVEQSMLAPSIIEKRVIPNGIDTSIFYPADKAEIRRKLNISQHSQVLLFMANNIQYNPFKDIHTLQRAVKLLAQSLPEQQIMFILLGGHEKIQEHIYHTQIQWIPFQKDTSLVADYFRASDMYLHSAKADTFPQTILEAMACGTPVIATAVGGIPEQIEHGKTGMLVPPGNVSVLSASIQYLLTNDSLRQNLGEAARKKVKRQFNIECMVETYLTWYQEILEAWRT